MPNDGSWGNRADWDSLLAPPDDDVDKQEIGIHSSTPTGGPPLGFATLQRGDVVLQGRRR
jgi:hypothetical protein